MKISLQKFFFSSLTLWLLVTGFGIYFLLGLKKHINFGVDLVGGTFITLEVQTEKAIELEMVNRMQMLVNKLKKENKEIPTTTTFDSANSTGVLTFASPDAARKAEDYLATAGFGYTGQREDSRLILSLKKDEIAMLKREALQGNIHVLEKRLNPTGASEITVVAKGEKHIIIELPNVHDIRQAKSMIGKTALLELKLVEDMGSSEAELLKKYPDGKLPENLMFVKSSERASRGGHMIYVVPKYTDITGRLLKDASMGLGGGDLGTEPTVNFILKPEGGEKFYDLTSNNIGRHIAIIIDNVVISAPVVNSAIETQGSIQGSFTPEEAQDLATILKSGAFTAPVSFEEERHIGPSLGAQSIRNGLVACGVGLLALLIFILLFYKTAGLLAFIVLLYNLLLILFALAWLGATLTLPGIAGMLLTIGMAIDASILIFERVKEELATGAPLKKAINTGFSGSMAVILDANITHFLVALVLYKLGAGPIKGFAITMIIGIISTLTTGLLLLRSIFNFLLDGLGVSKMRF